MWDMYKKAKDTEDFEYDEDLDLPRKRKRISKEERIYGIFGGPEEPAEPESAAADFLERPMNFVRGKKESTLNFNNKVRIVTGEDMEDQDQNQDSEGGETKGRKVRFSDNIEVIAEDEEGENAADEEEEEKARPEEEVPEGNTRWSTFILEIKERAQKFSFRKKGARQSFPMDFGVVRTTDEALDEARKQNQKQGKKEEGTTRFDTCTRYRDIR